MTDENSAAAGMANAAAEELSAPLLPHCSHEESTAAGGSESHLQRGRRPGSAPERVEHLSFASGIVYLVNAVVGAALLALPRALLYLGVIAFSVGLASVGFLTVLTIQFGLVFPSVLFDRRGSALRLGTYPAAVRHWVGGAAEYLLTITMLAGLLLVQTSNFDVAVDILVGDESTPGLLATLLQAICGRGTAGSAALPSAAACSSLPGSSSSSSSSNSSSADGAPWAQLLLNATSAWRPHQPLDLLSTGLWLSEPPAPHRGAACSVSNSGPGAAGDMPWWMALLLDRRVALGLIVVLVVLPLSLKRHMGDTAVVNAVGVTGMLTFLASVVTLAVAAVRAGKAHQLPLMPNWEQLAGGGGGGNPPGIVKEVASVLGVLSVLLTANTCYSNVHPMLAVVRPFSRRKAGAIVAITITLTTAFYWLVCTCAYLAFGPTIQGDVLQNLSPAQMEPLVGLVAAHAISVTVRTAYLVVIVVSVMVGMFPLRQVLADMLLGSPPQPPASMTVLAGPHQPVEGHRDEDAMLQPLDEEQGAHGAPVSRDRGVHKPQLLGHLMAAWREGEPVQLLHASAAHEAELATARALERHAAWRAALHLPLTVAVLALTFVLAVAVPNIWMAMSLLGSASASIVSFVMPALVGLFALEPLRLIGVGRTPGLRWVLYLTIALGLVIFANGWLTLALARAG